MTNKTTIKKPRKTKAPAIELPFDPQALAAPQEASLDATTAMPADQVPQPESDLPYKLYVAFVGRVGGKDRHFAAEMDMSVDSIGTQETLHAVLLKLKKLANLQEVPVIVNQITLEK